MNTTSPNFIRRIIIITGVAALSLAVAGIATAKPHGAMASDACKAEHFKKRLAQYDSNKDGKLDHAERQSMHQQRKAAKLAKYDADGDGTLSQQEREKARYDRIVAKFEAMDSNRDAEISRAEAEASCAPPARAFDKFDANGDNVITWTEFENAASKWGKKGKKGKRGHKGHKKMRY